MRAMFMMVASVLLAAGLFGCNRTPQAPVAAPVVAQTPPAYVPPPPPPPPAVEQTTRTRHHRMVYREESTGYDSYSQSEYGSSESYDDYSGGEESSVSSQDAASAEAIWVDGFGRSHYATTTQADENPALLSEGEQRDRDSVWHGYGR